VTLSLTWIVYLDTETFAGLLEATRLLCGGLAMAMAYLIYFNGYPEILQYNHFVMFHVRKDEIWCLADIRFKDRNQGKNEDRNDDKDATVIASCSSRAQSDGGFQPTGQSTPSTSHAATLSLTSTGFCDAAAADVDNDVIQSDTHWADTVDMDATDSTVIVTCNDDAKLWKAGIWRFARGCRYS